MKKRILALVVCLLLCLPLVLTSCGKFVKQIAPTMVEDKTGYQTAASTAVEGTFKTINNKFLYSTEYDDGETTHRVYNVLTGSVVLNTSTDSADSESLNVGYIGENLFYTAFTDEDDTTYAIYNDAGTSLLTGLKDRPSALTNFECDAVIADNKLYFFEEGSLNMKKDLNDTVVDADVLGQLKTAGEKYVLVSGKKIFAFDENFTQVDVQTFTNNSKAYYKSESSNSFILDNGNVLVQVKSTVGDYEDVFDANYDFVEEGTCYVLDTYIYNTKRMNYKEINLNYVIESVTTATEYFEANDCGFVKEAENKASAYKIDNEEVVYGVNNDASVTLYLTNKGKVQEFEITDEGTGFEAISDTRYLVNGDYFTRVYDEKNKLVGEIGRARGFNKNFIYTSKAIYKTDDLSLVVALDDKTTVLGATVDSIAYKTVNEKGDKATYYLATASNSAYILGSSDDETSVSVAPSKYYISVSITEDNTDETISILKTTGETITSYDADHSKGEDVSFAASSALDDNAVIVVSETEEGETEYSFVVLSR